MRKAWLALLLLVPASPAWAQPAPADSVQATIDERISESLAAAAPAAEVTPESIGISETPPVRPDASLADPTSETRLLTPLDAADIERRIDKGLTAAGEETEFPPDYAYGAFQRGWFLTAFARALERATEGDAAAQTLLGELLARGLGVKQDVAAAADWYGLAAAAGDPEAQFALARLYLEGQGVEQDASRAADLFQQAADQNQPAAAREFGLLLLQGNGRPMNEMLGAAYLRRAAAFGDMDAQYALAGLYVEGIGVVANARLAARWFGEAAQNGHVGAQVEYAIMLFNGRGVTADQAAAAEWFREASLADNPAAQLRFARLLADGVGVEADAEEAARWYLVARSRGLRDEYLDAWLAGLDESVLASATEAANFWTGTDTANPAVQAAADGAEPVDNAVE
jgi:TPR repeat protein